MLKLAHVALVIAVCTLVEGLAAAQPPQQPAPQAYTVIQVKEMHCAGCAKRIGSKLQATPGVKAIQFDVEKKLFWVHPNPGVTLSAKALWEAVELGNEHPVMLQGPTGTFRAKPQS